MIIECIYILNYIKLTLLTLLFSGFDDLNLTINTDMATVVKAMASPDSGLEIRDRMWLKITIPNAFIGTLSHYYTKCLHRYSFTLLYQMPS